MATQKNKFLGGLVASAFTLSYILAPAYVIATLILIPFIGWKSFYLLIPILVSALTPIIKLPWLVRHPIFRTILDYFDFETIFETTDDSLLEYIQKLKQDGRGGVILAAQPHGVLSYGGICAGAAADSRFDNLVTAAAGAVLATPIIKHVVGVFGLIDASGPSLRKHLSRGGVEGSCVLYIGGIAELFRCSESHETLILQQRKGFIKLALQTGADILPLYFFGNTSVLSVFTNPFLETISRKYQISLTWFWGIWGLPIPRPHKIIYVRGAPLGLPHIREPTDEDINKWHGKYVTEVQRIFDTYKKRIPRYADKTLIIE
jgi:hypothetical protein